MSAGVPKDPETDVTGGELHTKEQVGRRLREVALLEGDFVLRSGRRSSYYLDKYLFETDPHVLRGITREFGALVRSRQAARTWRVAGSRVNGSLWSKTW